MGLVLVRAAARKAAAEQSEAEQAVEREAANPEDEYFAILKGNKKSSGEETEATSKHLED